MRTPNLGSAQYVPGQVPTDAAEMQRFLRDEFNSIGVAIACLAAGHLDQVHVAPIKPRRGDIRLADGANWNPGSGQGVYYYNGTIWKFLG